MPQRMPWPLTLGKGAVGLIRYGGIRFAGVRGLGAAVLRGNRGAEHERGRILEKHAAETTRGVQVPL